MKHGIEINSPPVNRFTGREIPVVYIGRSEIRVVFYRIDKFWKVHGFLDLVLFVYNDISISWNIKTCFPFPKIISNVEFSMFNFQVIFIHNTCTLKIEHLPAVLDLGRRVGY